MSKKDLKHEEVKVSIRQIQDVRKRVFDSLRPFANTTFSGSTLDRATQALAFSVPKSCLSLSCSQDMLVKYSRQPITIKDIKTLACRIAGNLEHVMAGCPIYDNDWRSRSGWGLVQIIGVDKGVRVFKDNTSQRGAWLDLEVHTGPASGNKIRKFWSSDMIGFARYRIGFSRPVSSPTSRAVCSYPFLDESYLFNLYFLGMFDHLALSGDKPDYTKFMCTPYLENINRELLKKRFRAVHPSTGFTCPMGMAKSVQCHRCPSGADQCEAAVKAKSYVSDECKKCKELAWLDPDKSGYCINCCTSLSLDLIKASKD